MKIEKLIFATHNQHKATEIKAVIQNTELVTLHDLDDHKDIPETGNTLKANALIKAETIYRKYKLPVFADDTGLIIDALNGAPGVYSARYAGENCSFQDNVNKVLQNLSGQQNRTARFKTVICLFLSEKEIHYFEGVIEGEITERQSGNCGFGYDPIFKPEGYNQTFAEISAELKNKISHRSIATQKLVHFINN